MAFLFDRWFVNAGIAIEGANLQKSKSRRKTRRRKTEGNELNVQFELVDFPGFHVKFENPQGQRRPEAQNQSISVSAESFETMGMSIESAHARKRMIELNQCTLTRQEKKERIRLGWIDGHYW
jgi:hypothetical protein